MMDSTRTADVSPAIQPLADEAGPLYDAEIAAITWLLDEVRAGRALPVVEAKAVVHSIFVSMRSDGSGALRLRPLRDMSEYASVHALNVSMLSMGLAEHLGFELEAVRDVGLAGLLADVGLARVSADLRAKSDQLDQAERDLIKAHPAVGARIIIEADAALALAAVVAYEHHLRLDGAGYPKLSYPRTPHRISGLVQVCDTYHALRSPRPFRQAWPKDVIFSFLTQRAGTEFDPEMAHQLIALVSTHS